MNNPYSQSRNSQFRNSPSPHQQGYGNPREYDERHYGRDRNERWGAEESRGRATWRDDNSNRAPNRSAWGELQADEYDQDWQGGNYGEYGYDAGAASDHGMPSGEDYDYTQHQDYRLGSAPGRSQSRVGGQMYGAQNYGQPYYRSPDYGSMSYGAQSYGAQSYGPRLYGGEFGYGDEFRTARENWRPSGGMRAQGYDHRGKGPKGYVRTDERIREEICECLSDDPRIDASEIAVAVREGIVTLDGSVQDRAQKHRAEDIADGCNGVKDVHNALRVTREGQGSAGLSSSSGQSVEKGRDSKMTRQ